MKRGFLLLILLVITFGIKAHPVHVSVINLDIDSTGNTLNFSVRLFYDDFQMIVNHIYNTDINFDAVDTLSDEQKTVITDYIDHYLKFMAEDGDTASIRFKTFEKRDNTIWFYFSGYFTHCYDVLIVQNMIMADIFGDQKNMLIYRFKNTEEGIIFDRNTTEYKIVLTDG